MDSQDVWIFYTITIVALISGLLFSALFSAAELAFFNYKSITYSTQNNPKSKSILQYQKLMESPEHLLSSILIGNTLSNILAITSGTLFSAYISFQFQIHSEWIFFFEVFVLSILILIMSEITPKISALSNPISFINNYGVLIFSAHRLFKYVGGFTNFITQILSKKLPKASYSIEEHDILSMIKEQKEGEALQGGERKIIENIVEYPRTITKEIMTDRTHVIALPSNIKTKKAIEIIKKYNFTRYPIYDQKIDNIVGILHTKSILNQINEETKQNINTTIPKEYIRPPIFVPTTKRVEELFYVFQEKKNHIAIVVDEYGGMAGIVTIDDILEEIFGHLIRHSNRHQQLKYEQIQPKVYLFNASTTLNDVSDIIGVSLEGQEDDFETLGGLFYHITKHIPELNEGVVYKNTKLTVHSLKKNHNHIEKIKVQVLKT